MVHPLVDYFRCPEQVAVLGTAEALSPEARYFRVAGAMAYGRAVGPADASLVDVLASPGTGQVGTSLPFDLAEVVANLRHERYPEALRAASHVTAPSLTRSLYYVARPWLPVHVRKRLQRLYFRGWESISFPRWPVDTSVDALMRTAAGLALASGQITEFPFIWFWPDGAKACAMMTHDVEGAVGMAFCGHLMDLDESFSIPSSFQLVPEAPWATRDETRQLAKRLRARGFEVNIHDLSHDGRLFCHRERFDEHAAVINALVREFGSRGFRSGAMYRRQDWLTALDISYDMSVPNVAHLEPQRGGCCTVMPYFNGHVLELPLTTAQDYTLFHVLGDYSTALWEQQIQRIVAESGLVSVIAHPDYLVDERACSVYGNLLRLLGALRAERQVWIAPPAQIDAWWRARRAMTLVRKGSSWEVEGAGSERARVAWVRLRDDHVVYDVAPARRAA